ncbi:MAG: hypothetical protein HOE14_16725 [Gemmatimonadales bacterium]|jgi:hypothetical protein|nr:hypothetical protein [Gemmatimonadales bacterium]
MGTTAMPPYRIWLGEVEDPSFARYHDPDRPQLLLGSARDDPLQRMEKLADRSLDHSKFAQTYGIEPRMDLLETLPTEIGALESYRKKDDASKVRAQVRDHLLDQGYVVADARTDEVYTIYIVNLVDDSASGPSPGKWVYVGETSKTPEERFDEHKNGIRANKDAREHGRDLNYDLMKRIPQVRFKQDSKWLEADTGEKMRSRGYVVEGAH